MAVECHVAVGVQLVEQRLSVLGLLDAQALKALILRIAVALQRADADDVMAAHAPGMHLGKVAVHLHSGQNGHRPVAKILPIVNAMVGQRHEIIAMVGMHGDDLLGRSLTVGARRVAVQRSLEHLISVFFKGSLSFHLFFSLQNFCIEPSSFTAGSQIC